MPTEHARAVALLDAYYAEQLGCPVTMLATAAPQPAVVPCARREQRSGLHVSPVLALWRAGGGAVVSASPPYADALRACLAGLDRGVSAERAASWAAANVPDVVAREYPGAWASVSRVLTVGLQGAPALSGAAVCGGDDRRWFWALTPAEERAARAEASWSTATVANIAVETAPRFRRMGYGRAAVAEAVRAVSARGGAPLYLHRVENAASAALADSLGLMTYGWVLEASALDLPAEDLRRLPPGARGALVSRGVFERGSVAAHWRRVYAQEPLLESDAVGGAADRLFTALAVPGRVLVLRALLRAWGPAHVEDVALACGLGPSAVRAHCQALDDVGLAQDHLGGVFSVPPWAVSTAMGLLAAASDMAALHGGGTGGCGAGSP